MQTLQEEPVAVGKLRTELSQIRQAVQFRQKEIPVAYYGSIVGVVLPAARAQSLNPAKSRTISLVDFRTNLNAWWGEVQSGTIDCIYLSFHGGEPVIAFVNPRLLEA